LRQSQRAVSVTVASGVKHWKRLPGQAGAQWGGRWGNRGRSWRRGVAQARPGSWSWCCPLRERCGSCGSQAAAAPAERGASAAAAAAAGWSGVRRGDAGVVVVEWTLAQDSRSARRETWRAAASSLDSRSGRCIQPRNPRLLVKAAAGTAQLTVGQKADSQDEPTSGWRKRLAQPWSESAVASLTRRKLVIGELSLAALATRAASESFALASLRVRPLFRVASAGRVNSVAYYGQHRRRATVTVTQAGKPT
jgi:hypothetical protein